MNPRIVTISHTRLLGKRMTMSLANNRTQELWQHFMPDHSKITGRVGSEFYSVEVYGNTSYFNRFDPTVAFEKWAAVKVSDYDMIPKGMETLELPEGPYAVFPYKGKDSDAPKTYQWIYGTWIPQSGYLLDNRPHFAKMGDKYQRESPDSEEEFWVPIRPK